jgi:hypothetical protein
MGAKAGSAGALIPATAWSSALNRAPRPPAHLIQQTQLDRLQSGQHLFAALPCQAITPRRGGIILQRQQAGQR